mmetsp:Transcript_47075/g.75361  ORF Transcript_47075/g.75361 Transcript_47075/m.75361 type:complete len:194 (-) Transcript_47075:516-1097(-)
MAHTFMHRVNSLFTFAGTVLAGMCVLATLTDQIHTSDPQVSVKVAMVERFMRIDRNDEAYLAFDIDADLTSVFSWNTKQLFVSLAVEYETKINAMNQVSVWDRVVERREDAVLVLPYVRNKYKLVDQGSNLQGLAVNLTLEWNVMPITGSVSVGRRTITGFRLPQEYLAADPSTMGIPHTRAGGRRGGMKHMS